MKLQFGAKLAGLVALIAVAVAVTAFWDPDRPIIFKLSWQEGKFEIGIPNAEMIRELMRDDTDEQKATREIVLAILQSNYQVYELRNPETVNHILALGYEHPLMMGLRRAVISGKSDILPKGHSVTLLDRGGLEVDQAAVCEGSEFVNNQIVLFRPDYRSVWLYASQLLNSEDCGRTPNQSIGINKDAVADLEKNGELRGFKARVEPKRYRLYPSPPFVATLGNGTSTRGEN